MDRWLVTKVDPVKTELGTVDVLQWLGRDLELDSAWMWCDSIEDHRIVDYPTRYTAFSAAREHGGNPVSMERALGMADGASAWGRLQESGRILGATDVVAARRMDSGIGL